MRARGPAQSHARASNPGAMRRIQYFYLYWYTVRGVRALCLCNAFCILHSVLGVLLILLYYRYL
eukprot:COSAG02_NODE_9079_length_2339_cov_1.450000_1_plen_64_part_00